MFSYFNEATLGHFGSFALTQRCLTNHRAGGVGAQPRDRLDVQRVTRSCFVRQYLTRLIFFFFSSVKCEVQGFCGGAEAEWLHRPRLDEAHRKLPQPTSSFALLQKKEERSTGPR